jgi:hypothetical protein
MKSGCIAGEDRDQGQRVLSWEGRAGKVSMLDKSLIDAG